MIVSIRLQAKGGHSGWSTDGSRNCTDLFLHAAIGMTQEKAVAAYIEELLESFLEGDEKFIVFAYHR